MNPQQFYQYQIGSSPNMQTITNQGTAPYLASHAAASAGSLPLPLMPPPPPPAFFAKAFDSPTPKVVEAPAEISAGAKSTDDGTAQDNSSAECPTNLKGDLTKVEISSSNAVVSDPVVSSTVAIPSASQPASFVSGVYAGAYIQHAMSPAAVSTPSATGAHSQYVFAPGVTQLSAAQAPKLMYLPPTVPHGAVAGGSCYIPQAGVSSPQVVTDQTGKSLIVGNPMQMPVQYQLASHAGLKPTIPQQYVLASTPYYNTLQSGAALQPVFYSPVQNVLPTAQSAIAPFGGLAPAAANSQVYYYQY